VADQHGVAEIALCEQVRNVGAVGRNRALVHCAWRLAMTAQIASDHRVALGEMPDLGLPVGARAAEAVHENERRRADA
jgi:hypothetical protein